MPGSVVVNSGLSRYASERKLKRMTQPQPERFQFTSSDGLSIACVKWSGDHPVRGVVQIAHDNISDFEFFEIGKFTTEAQSRRVGEESISPQRTQRT